MNEEGTSGPLSKPLIIFPCNGNAIEALDCLGAMYRCIAFVDDATEKQGTEVHGFPVRAREELVARLDAFVLAVPGSPTSYRGRRQVVEGLGLTPNRFARVIHPAARISRHAVIGQNVLIMAGVVITSNAIIGNHVCILPNSVVHHDAVVGDWSLVGTNVTIAGGTVIGQNCYIGSGSSIMNGVRVEEGAMVGLGSNVIRNVAAGATVVGNPARQIH